MNRLPVGKQLWRALACTSTGLMLAGGLAACSWIETLPGFGSEPALTEFETRAQVFTSPVVVAPANAQAFQARCAAAVEMVSAMRDELAQRNGPAGVQDLKDLDAINRLMIAVGFGEGSLIAETNPEASVRAAGDECQQKMSDLASSVSLSRPIYERIQSIDAAGLSERDQYVLGKVLEDFKRAGVDKDEATRARISELESALTEISLRWGKNMREARRTLEIDSVQRLAGMPQDYIDAHQPNEQGKIVISTAYPDVFPILSYAKDANLRRDVLDLFHNRAYPQNVSVLRELLETRYEYAKTLGYASWAEYAIANKMAASPARVQSFLDQLEQAAKPAAKIEYQLLLDKLQETDARAKAVPEWSGAYLKNALKQSDYALDPQEVRQYFAYDNVRKGIITLVEDLFEVEIRDWADAPVWHESVTAHALYQNDSLIGRFYLDMHPREGKYSHAAAFPLRIGPTSDGVPLVSLICNFPQGGHDSGLMEHSQVETFLHEFGHLIHMLFGAQPDYTGLAMNNIEWDFVEAPSQMLEEWVWDYASLSKFALNKDGEVLPKALFEKMLATRNLGLGMNTLRQLHYANVSLNYYNRPPEQVDFKNMWDQFAQRFSLYQRSQDKHQYAAFGHLDGYSAYYYTYQWSLAIATDMFSQFAENGLRDAETARRYKEKVLAQGSAKSAETLISDFLGRPWSVDAYEKVLNEAAQSEARH